MKYFIFTLGCQMNVSDSERIKTVLDLIGFKEVSEKEADLIVVNACSVRQSAVDRIYGKLKVWKGKKVIITGCLLPKDKEKLKERVNLIFKIKDLPKLPKMLSKIFNLKLEKNTGCIKNYFKIPSLILHPSSLIPKNKCSAFVPIMTGCDHFCTYCVVPYTRGREYSRPENQIIKEVKNFVKKGAKEIILLGQNVNRYRSRLKIKDKKSKIQSKNKREKNSFVRLLQKIVKIPGDFKIKFISSNPWDFSTELIDLIASESKLLKEIHLPVQSGDNEILKKMNRPYANDQYLGLIENLKLKIENLKLSTDIIIGFPGETKKAFENTQKLCKKAKFNKAYIAQYSPRPGTAAEKLKDDVPRTEKKRRWKILDKMINKKY